jgi:feruloyl esterase
VNPEETVKKDGRMIRAMRSSRRLACLAIVTFALTDSAPAAGPSALATCDSLASLKLPNVTMATAQAVAAGPLTIPGRNPMTVPAMCRVAGSITPSPDSDIRFEVWMPASGWNGKFQGIGNGGFAGSIDYNLLSGVVGLGYAVASTDTGHTGDALNATWALGHPDKVTDFGHRAIHETTVAAKAIIAAFYGNAPRRSYFGSCSNGGRQALMEAQRYPEDYDGILAGAPANDWTHLLTTAIWDHQVQLNPKARILPAKLPAIEAATLAACDKNDGVEDGVIENPAACRFDPAVLQCKAEESDACLTPTQVEGLKMLYSGPRNDAMKVVYPGHPVGGATGNGGWSAWITGPAAGTPSVGAQFGLGFFRNMVFERADWNPITFTVDRDLKIADDKLGATLNAVDPDLTRFARRGGKLIVYHGWADPAISAQSSIDYFNSVVSHMGATPAANVMRLYMVPGVQHCGGGPGPDNFGQGGPSSLDPARSMTMALEAWVEKGTAPQHIVATKYRPNAPTPRTAADVTRTRPLCPYPQIAKWKGTGSTDEAGNFVCTR